MRRRTLSEFHPALYRFAVRRRTFERTLANRLASRRMALAEERDTTPLPVKVHRHNSLIRRRLGNTQLDLQEGKAASLAIAAPLLDGILIRPGQTFSLWHLVGRPSAERGFGVGLIISNDHAEAGTGGGLCQLSNLVHWLVLHSPLEIVEHHHHSGLDLFPDHRRQIPFGTGTSIAYNYVDYRFRNPTDATFQLRASVDGEYLRGELRADRELPQKFHVRAKDECFYRAVAAGGEPEVRRHNVVWRTTIDKRTGNVVAREQLQTNDAHVCYDESLVPATIHATLAEGVAAARAAEAAEG